MQLRDVDEGLVSKLRDELGLLSTTARCLVARGIDDTETAKAFLAPRLGSLRPPTGLADLSKAVDRIAQAVTGGQKIGCFGDYDVDGVSTCALLTGYLRSYDAEVVPRVATRQGGYGFGLEHANALLDEGCQLIITGDCGTSDIASIEACRAKGVDVVVIDHHTVPTLSPDDPHPAFALVNPFRPDSDFPFRGMASVGLAFYVAAAIRTRLDGPKQALMAELDLVALGTVADLVPLAEENRILTTHGLHQLNRAPRLGIRALLSAAKVEDKRITERTIGWKIGPRLNAPGRLGDAKPALELLLAKEPQEADRFAQIVEKANADRREAQESIRKAVETQLEKVRNDSCVVLAGEGWASGVVGIVASRIAEETGRPTFIIGVDPETGEGRGSGRSARGINLYSLLEKNRDLLDRFGGHAAAAGLTVGRDQIEKLREGLILAANEQETSAEPIEQVVDAEIGLPDVNERLTKELLSLGPFGKGNEEPTLTCRGVRVNSSRRVGDGSHLKLELEEGGTTRGAIGFGLGASDPGPDALVDVVFAPMLNEWRGRTSVELGLKTLSKAN